MTSFSKKVFLTVLTLLSIYNINIFADASQIGTDLFTDSKKLFQLGHNLSKTEAYTYSALACVSIASIWRYDSFIESHLLYHDKNQFKNKLLHSLSRPAYWYGKNGSNIFYTWGLVSTGLAGAGLISDNPKHYNTVGLLTESLLFTFFATGGTKIIFGRERPSLAGSSGNFKFFETKSEYRSMPSGHTSLAFTIATVLAKRYDSYFVSLPAYTIAFCAGLERIEHRHHWFSDVIVGAMLGYYIGKTVVKINQDRPPLSGNKINSAKTQLIQLSIPLN